MQSQVKANATKRNPKSPCEILDPSTPTMSGYHVSRGDGVEAPPRTAERKAVLATFRYVPVKTLRYVISDVQVCASDGAAGTAEPRINRVNTSMRVDVKYSSNLTGCNHSSTAT